ncbi:NCS2 family permease [Photobacterium sanctipauli]|uniref:NCS2 family permease n=1 Tax=Photobacterium sanctipauli TaxID=1342794 RepID=A0A2T3NRE9_9GAMM|nr:NCS2 family permease [Photobacterium sanctipauli]PSW18812.1 NCS2 family permease [Photobacterium sanctipauli]
MLTQELEKKATLSDRLDSRFQFSQQNSSLKTEVMAGITTFMAMAYILIVHPSFMRVAGMDVGAVTVAVALFSALGCFAMGYFTNLPFAIGPAMGGNAFFAFTLVAQGVVNWQTAMGMVFISGAAFILLTFLGLRELIVRMMPTNVKIAIGAAIGLFIAQLGFKSGGLMVIGEGAIKLGSMSDSTVLLTLLGLVLAFGFAARKINGGLLLAIIIVTIIGIPLGMTQVPEQLVSLPPSIAPIAFELDIWAALQFGYISFIFTFFVGDFFSTLGTLLGVSEKAGFLDKDGNLPNINRPFWVDSLATTIGSLFGMTTLTTFIESAAGVEAGGRTGLTAIVTGICFLLCLFLVPLVVMIPAFATAPVLIMLGISMLTCVKRLEFDDPTEAMPAFATIVFCAFTSSIANGISIGILSYIAIKLLAGRHRDVHPGLYVLAIPLIYFFAIK